MENKKVLFRHIDHLLMTYCEDCLLYEALKEEEGRVRAYQFCLRECTIGKKLQEIGKKLS